MIYAEKKKQESPYVSVNTLTRGRNYEASTALVQTKSTTEPTGEQETKKEASRLEHEEIPSAGTFANEMGIVAPEANLRPGPDTNNQPLKRLPFNTKVMIIKELEGGWSYISTETGDTGYVASYLVKRGLPEPGAVLHKTESGETAIGIAERYYGRAANQWGQDLRYYVNVLVHVNGGAGDDTKGIYTSHAGANWQETQVRSGYYIWIPSLEFAKSLQGVVASSSRTYGIKEWLGSTVDFFRQKLDDFKYANQFVGRLIPQKLSDDVLGAIKSALINFAMGMIAAGLLLGIATGLGALIGALIGVFAGGVGAAPGAALGAQIGFEIGLFLLKWIGLGLFATYGLSLLGRIGSAFGEYVIAVWKAKGDRGKLEESADLCAEAIKEFLLGVLEIVIMLVAAWGVGRAMGALANTKFGKKLGVDKLIEWVNRRSRYESTRETISSLGAKTYTYNMIENPGPLVNIDPQAAGTFAGGKYNVIILENETILYRVGRAGGGRNAFGQYFTRNAPQSRAAARIDYAVRSQWIDPKTGALTGSSPIEVLYALKFPKGTMIFEGPAGYQTGVYIGGGEQIFIFKPWEIPGVQVISEIPLP